MSSGPKPIETRYKGYRMRSRAEARFAVLFDALEIRWEFEKEGFDLGAAGYYLPDFWLPDLKAWVEIKGSYPPRDERRKIKALAMASGHDVFLFDRPDFQSPEMDLNAPSGRDFYGAWARLFSPRERNDDDEGDFGFWLAECLECLHIRETSSEQFSWPPFIGLPCTTHWTEHGLSHSWPPGDEGRGVRNTPRLRRAYDAARSARFEFGESGASQ